MSPQILLYADILHWTVDISFILRTARTDANRLLAGTTAVLIVNGVCIRAEPIA
jgi:hypothetical protein